MKLHCTISTNRHINLILFVLLFIYSFMNASLCKASTPGHLLVVEAGAPAFRSYLLKDLNTSGYKITLFTHVPADWANEYVSNIVFVDMSDVQQTLSTARQMHLKDPFTGVLTWNEGATPMVNYLQHALGLPTLSSDLRPAFRNKLMMRQNWSISNVNNPRYQILTSVADLKKVTNYPIVLKPEELMGSAGVLKVTNQDYLNALYHKASNADETFTIDKKYSLSTIYGLKRSVLAEEFIPGDEYSVEGFVQHGNVTILGITEKKLIKSDVFFDEVGHIFPALLDKEKKIAIEDQVIKAAHGLKLVNSFFHAEVRIGDKDKKVYMIEMAARLGGGFISKLVSLSLCVNITDLLGKIASGQTIAKINNKAIRSVGIAFISAKKEHFLRNISKIEWINKPNHLNLEIVEKSTYVQIKDKLVKPVDCGDTRLGHVIFILPKGVDHQSSFEFARSLLNVE